VPLEKNYYYYYYYYYSYIIQVNKYIHMIHDRKSEFESRQARRFSLLNDKIQTKPHRKSPMVWNHPDSIQRASCTFSLAVKAGGV
jgi:hypothetical protein